MTDMVILELLQKIEFDAPVSEDDIDILGMRCTLIAGLPNGGTSEVGIKCGCPDLCAATGERTAEALFRDAELESNGVPVTAYMLQHVTGIKDLAYESYTGPVPAAATETLARFVYGSEGIHGEALISLRAGAQKA